MAGPRAEQVVIPHAASQLCSTPARSRSGRRTLRDGYCLAMPNRFYRRSWDEIRGDEFDDWAARSGTSRLMMTAGLFARSRCMAEAGFCVMGPNMAKIATEVSAKPVFTAWTRTGAASRSPVPNSSGPGGRSASNGFAGQRRPESGSSGCRTGRRNGDMTDHSESPPVVLRWCGWPCRSRFFVPGSDGIRVIK